MYVCCIVDVELELEHGGTYHSGTGAYIVTFESEFELHPFSSHPPAIWYRLFQLYSFLPLIILF